MATQKQIEANRRNARRSTGPRTAEGKSVSKLNALRTGIFAEAEVLPDEDPAELAAEYEDFYKPSSPAERCCVAALVSADWLLRRFRRIEADLWDYESLDYEGKRRRTGLTYLRCKEPLSRLQRRIDSADRSFHRALQRLDKLRSIPATLTPATENAPPPEPAATPEVAPEPENAIGFVPSFSICATPPAPEPRTARPAAPCPLRSADGTAAASHRGLNPGHRQLRTIEEQALDNTRATTSRFTGRTRSMYPRTFR